MSEAKAVRRSLDDGDRYRYMSQGKPSKCTNGCKIEANDSRVYDDQLKRGPFCMMCGNREVNQTQAIAPGLDRIVSKLDELEAKVDSITRRLDYHGMDLPSAKSAKGFDASPDQPSSEMRPDPFAEKPREPLVIPQWADAITGALLQRDYDAKLTLLPAYVASLQKSQEERIAKSKESWFSEAAVT